jgi:protein TonB
VIRALGLAAAFAAAPSAVAAADVTPMPLQIRVSRPQTPAAYRSTPLPAYPARAREQGVEGVVVLNVEVLSSGRVGVVVVAVSSGAPVLDQAAAEAVRRWTFEPARNGARAVDSLVEVPVKFSLKNQ